MCRTRMIEQILSLSKKEFQSQYPTYFVHTYLLIVKKLLKVGNVFYYFSVEEK